MENPYQPPAKTSLPSPPNFHWKRVVVWSVLIFVAANMVGLISGFTMGNWEIYGRTMEEAIINARLIRRIGYGIVGAILYWWFATGVASKPLLHVVALFALVQVIDLLFSFFVFSVPANELFDYWAIGRSFLAAMVGLGIAWLGSNNSFKPKPLRGSA
jgi:hypothetical protein